MTRAEALALASEIADTFSDAADDPAPFLLLLRWMAYKAGATDREVIYVETEGAHACYVEGVDETIARKMKKELDALRQRQKGEA